MSATHSTMNCPACSTFSAAQSVSTSILGKRGLVWRGFIEFLRGKRRKEYGLPRKIGDKSRARGPNFQKSGSRFAPPGGRVEVRNKGFLTVDMLGLKIQSHHKSARNWTDAKMELYLECSGC